MASLDRHLRTAWSDHAIVGVTNVTVVAASAGRWKSGPACASPAVWFFLTGHLRTFAWTAPFLARVADASSACTMIVAAVPDEIDAPREVSTPGGAYARVDHSGLERSLGSAPNVPSLVRQIARTSMNRSSFAYAVLRRSGAINVYPAALAFGWHAVWALAEWVCQMHSLVPDAASIVVRTRPDVVLTLPLDIRGLREYVLRGRHGRHLMLAQVVRRPSGANAAQSDIHAIFSYGSYESDVARPLERAGARQGLEPAHAKLWWQRGFASGWGYGRTVDVWAKDPLRFGALDTLSPSPSEALFSVEHAARDAADGLHSPMRRCSECCLCGDGVSTSCRRPSCLVTSVESLVVRTDPCNVKLLAAILNTSQGGAAGGAGAMAGTRSAAPRAVAPCVLRGPAPWPPYVESAAAVLVRQGQPFDLAANVTCYCAAESTTPSTVAGGGLVCSLHEHAHALGQRCFRANDTHRVKLSQAGHYRCKGSGVMLQPEMDAVEGRSRVWPVGCGGDGFAAPQKTVPLAACTR